MDQDPMDPGIEAFGFAQAWELFPGRHEGLLHGILGTSDIAQDPMRDPEQPISRTAGDRGEGLLVPGPRRLYERSVHLCRSVVRAPSVGRVTHYERRAWADGVKMVKH